MKINDLLDAGTVVEIRGDGKAGSGLLMAMQMFGSALGKKSGIHVHEWPLFGSARKGANVRAYMRIADHPIHTTASIVRPHIAILLDEIVSEELDFASGMDEGMYIVNTPSSAKEAAQTHKLRGTTIAVDGNALGDKYLGKRMGNVSIFAALIHISGILTSDEGREALAKMMVKRRLPESVQKANVACYDESLSKLAIEETKGEADWTHELAPFPGFADMPMGAQSELRTSLANITSRYRPSGLSLVFNDPERTCSGCALCLTNCPENIITFEPDPKKGLQVTGANVTDFCKLCEECVQVCPIHLFSVAEEAPSCQP